MANLVIAYVLWLIGGWWGLQHFYLGRDKHAFLWWSTCGCFGLGWIRDCWRLPEYVNAANNNPGYLKDLNEKAKLYPSPTLSVGRFAGELIVGFLFGLLVRLAIPEEFVESPLAGLGHKLSIRIIVPPLGVAVGEIFFIELITAVKLV
jgi:DnaJ family protein C protein 22